MLSRRRPSRFLTSSAATSYSDDSGGAPLPAVLPVGCQRPDLPGRLGPRVRQRLRQHHLLRIPRRRRVHGRPRLRRLRRRPVGRSSIRGPARVTARDLRILRARHRRAGIPGVAAAAASRRRRRGHLVVLAGRSWLVRAVSRIPSGAICDRRRRARAHHAAHGRHAHGADPSRRPPGRRERRPEDRRAVRRKHGRRRVGLLPDRLHVHPGRRAPGHADDRGVAEPRRRGGSAPPGIAPVASAGSGRGDSRSIPAGAVRFVTRGGTDRSRHRAVRFCRDGHRDRLVPTRERARGKPSIGAVADPHRDSCRHLDRLHRWRVPARAVRAPGDALHARSGRLRDLHPGGPGHGRLRPRPGRADRRLSRVPGGLGVAARRARAVARRAPAAA